MFGVNVLIHVVNHRAYHEYTGKNQSVEESA